MRTTLSDIFQSDNHPYDDIHEFVDKAIASFSKQPLLALKMRGTMAKIDLQGKTFILDRPLMLKGVQLINLCNGALIAGPDFPIDEYLIRINNAYGVVLTDLFIECSKRSNGIHLEKFLRIRVEDCHLVHQKNYGIYSSPTGGNHELEIFKCHISEFLFGDGYKEINEGVIPAFDIDANRVSTGIFLGQADNIVADCNINLCRTGIFSGMRANRIHGNHITGGGSKELELFKGIELNNFHKSSAMIVNNYIDNCCLWINCTSDPQKNLRNYIHVTDNLFYRGFNHPLNGGEFNHIVINPLEPKSLLANMHICDNKFYNQPENLNGIKPRIIVPIRVNERPGEDKTDSSNELVTLDHENIVGVTMKNNYFTNCFPTFVVPLGSTITKIIDIVPEKKLYRVSFEKEIPLGFIQTANASVVGCSEEENPIVTIQNIKSRLVTLSVSGCSGGKISVTSSAENSSHSKYNYIAH